MISKLEKGFTSAGLYFTKDDAKTWNKAELNGFPEVPLTIAAHPADDKVVALGNKEELFLSNDSGNHIEKLISGLLVTSLTFSNNGELFVSAANSPVMLQR